MSVKCLIYCSKAKPRLFKHLNNNIFYHSQSHFDFLSDFEKENILNGKIVASFDCEKVEVFTTDYRGNKEQNKRIVKDSCVPLGDLADYEIGKHFLYAIHISNLEIFDKPKDLSEYSKRLPNGDFQQLGKAPQNMMNVCKIKYLIEDYVLISIKPEWVAKILNGEKTIEVRKKVVNALKELI